jgi:cystathionine beta-lyase
MSFDEIVDRKGTLSAKWDAAARLYDVDGDTCLPMWVADSDFRAAPVIQDALQAFKDHGVYGYLGDYGPYKSAIQWWMKNRHDWDVDADWIFTTHGLVNAIGVALDVYTKPNDGVVLFTPIYHAFARVIKAAGRRVVECQMDQSGGKAELDMEAAEAAMTGSETMLILCSPHNPGGRVWRQDELETIADFAKRHDLILVSDEIHHDLVFPGNTHIPMAKIDGVTDRLLTLTASSKTFNLAGLHTGNAIIEDPTLRAAFGARMAALGLGPNTAGITAVTAAYSLEGAAWVDAQVAYIAENKRIFDEGVNAIPGLTSVPLESTYLAWVDFSGTGMEPAEFIARVEKRANIAANHGDTFGSGGETYMRFNLATQKSRVEDAVVRLKDAFSDLQ